MYVQFQCNMEKELIHQRRKGLYIAFTATLCSFVFMVYIYGSINYAELLNKKQDRKLCTTSDYTVRIDIPE